MKAWDDGWDTFGFHLNMHEDKLKGTESCRVTGHLLIPLYVQSVSLSPYEATNLTFQFRPNVTVYLYILYNKEGVQPWKGRPFVILLLFPDHPWVILHPFIYKTRKY